MGRLNSGLSAHRPRRYERLEPFPEDSYLDGAVSLPEPVPEGSAKVVMDWVGGDVDRAQLALTAEQAKEKPRKGLSNDLSELIIAAE